MKFLPLLILLAGCDGAVHIFTHGQCVEIKLTGEHGMVHSFWKNSDMYRVRVAKASKTNSAIFGADNTENQRYAIVTFREFELTECAQPDQEPS